MKGDIRTVIAVFPSPYWILLVPKEPNKNLQIYGFQVFPGSLGRSSIHGCVRCTHRFLDQHRFLGAATSRGVTTSKWRSSLGCQAVDAQHRNDERDFTSGMMWDEFGMFQRGETNYCIGAVIFF